MEIAPKDVKDANKYLICWKLLKLFRLPTVSLDLKTQDNSQIVHPDTKTAKAVGNILWHKIYRLSSALGALLFIGFLIWIITWINR